MASCVVFVCVANRVRSAFAEFFFLKVLSEKSDRLAREVSASSAGFIPQKLKEQLAKAHVSFPEPFFNRPINELTRAALLEKGIVVPAEWRSKELNREIVKSADLIITLLPEQSEEIVSFFPEAEGKVFTLREISKWDEYVIFEDYNAPPLNDNYWHFVEEDPNYVSKLISAMEESLIRAFPNILQRLEIGDTLERGKHV